MSIDRISLTFARQVLDSFKFLQYFGFSVTESSPTIVRYQKGDLQLNVYHGRRSYEIGFEIGREGTLYSISEVIRITDPGSADRYRSWMGGTSESVAKGVEQLANLVRQYAERALAGESAFFAALETQRKAWSREYALDVLAEQLRPKADTAFRKGDYREAANLYERIRSRLTLAEVKKLELAKKRSKS